MAEISKSSNKKIGGIGKRISSIFAGNNSFSLILVILCVWIIFQILTKGLFLTSRNLGTLLLQTSVLGLVTSGMIVVMIARGIDLSAGSAIALLSSIGAVLNINAGFNPAVVLVVMLGCAMIMASFQGLFIARLAIPAFIVTLAGQLYFKGFSLLVSRGSEHAPVSNILKKISTSWLQPAVAIFCISILLIVVIVLFARNNLTARKMGIPFKTTPQLIASLIPMVLFAVVLSYICTLKGMPVLAVILSIFAISLHIILNYTTFGRHVYAVGANPDAARLSGVNPQKIIFFTFVIMGFSYFFSSVGLMSRISGFVPGMAPLMELDAVAAAVIGGTSLLGGVGSIFGGILGALLLTSIDNGMFLLNVPTFYQYVAKGFILLLAVVMDITARKNKR